MIKAGIMHIQTIIEQLGYPANQVKIYLASLKMGEAMVSDIAERVALPRTTVAELVQTMHKHGLMNYYIKRSRKYWVAADPDKLLNILKERETMLASVLPQLHFLENNDGNKPAIHCYIGMEEIKNIFDDIIETKHHIKALVCWDDFKEYMGKRFVFDFIERRYKHFLRIRLITPKTPSALTLKSKDQEELRQTRFLSAGVSLRRVSNFIYGDKVAIISFNKKEPTGLVVEDPDVVHAQTIYFENLWQHSTDK